MYEVDVEYLVYIRGLMCVKWMELSCEMVLKSDSVYSEKDNSLVIMRNNMENLKVTDVMKLLEGMQECVEELLSDFTTTEDWENLRL